MGLSLHDRSVTRQAGASDTSTGAPRARRRSHSATSTRRAPLAAPRRARRRGVGHRVVDRMGGRGEGHERPRTGAAPCKSTTSSSASLASIVCFVAFGLYRAPSHGTRAAAPGAVAQAIAVAAVAVTGWQAVFGDAAPGLAVGAAGGGFLAVITARYSLRRLAARMPAPGPLPHPGRDGGHRSRTGPHSSSSWRSTTRRASRLPRPWATSGSSTPRWRPSAAHVGDDDPDPVPWLGGYESAVEAVHRTNATGVLVAVNHIPTGALHAPAAPRCRRSACRSTSRAASPGSPTPGCAARRVAHEPFLVLEPLRHITTQRAVKRTIDLIVAVAGADRRRADPRRVRPRSSSCTTAARCCSARPGSAATAARSAA